MILLHLTGLLIGWGRHNIDRGARWRGFAWDDDGLALVFDCDPESGIRRAYFHLAPLSEITFDKINGGGA